ncbi:membrane protein [Capsaspora owczarzaki ATCC 30864]|uniref:Membrane protein n=1 Tax=Capsaspora owczarzaki (strain ATCC 30864) TaxID=595528 RepID=A0A0D2VJ25_CAPO3|nr:membrane protein [Capsaspora owczarzaki ATCC 30864]KJE89987.1 membrane protein [Capsaspora owczarzaki ATCC 30864]|eukprot:XP_004349896.1 membrane protein [Capsaspora owczarzaki ATCC 30864]
MASTLTFNKFYPFYQSQHRDPVCRLLHVIGTTIVVSIVAAAIATANARLLLFTPLVGYGFAWVGHFFFERNKPATFKHPFYSLMGDFVMWFNIIRGEETISSPYVKRNGNSNLKTTRPSQ